MRCTRAAVVGVRLIAAALHAAAIDAAVVVIDLAITAGCGELQLRVVQTAGDRVTAQCSADTRALHVHIQGLLGGVAP
ncbi:hypothetical protein D3C81_1687580 [compost metagenome]